MPNRIPLRTSNEHEVRVAAELEAQGYEVLKRGWPDFLAIRGDEIRLIEVKPPHSHFLKPAQYRVAMALAKLGIEVEVAAGSLSQLEPAVLSRGRSARPGSMAQTLAQRGAILAQSNASQAQFERSSGFESEDVRASEEQELAPKEAGRARLTYPQAFLEFWSAYPLKRGKRKAFFAWKRALSRATNEALIDGAKRYRDDPNRAPEFTKYAEGWLNGDQFEDEPLPSRNGRATPTVDRATEIHQQAEELRRAGL